MPNRRYLSSLHGTRSEQIIPTRKAHPRVSPGTPVNPLRITLPPPIGICLRLATAHRVGKIAALQRDLEEEPQGSGTDVDGRYRRSDRPQPQLIAMDVLGGGLVGRPAQEIGKPFDVANIVLLSLGAKPPDRHVLGRSLGAPVLGEVLRPLNLKTGRLPPGTPQNPSGATNYRESGLVHRPFADVRTGVLHRLTRRILGPR